MEKKDKILIICIANYCRSPVAEVLLKSLCPAFEVQSAGIFPMTSPAMDPRSSDYLSKKGFDLNLHIPRKVTKDELKQCKYIFAMDAYVLSQINKIYQNPKYKLLNFKNPKTSLADPYKFSDSDSYNIVMENIFQSCKLIAHDLNED